MQPTSEDHFDVAGRRVAMRGPHEGGNRHIDIDNRYHERPIYDTSIPKGSTGLSI